MGLAAGARRGMLTVRDMEAATARQSVETPGWQPPQSFRDARLHMVGIGGSGMSGLAALLLRRGAVVSGSDRQAGPLLERLSAAGARVVTRQSADSIPPDAELVVASAAIKPDHPELLEARRRGLPVIKYARMLGAVMAQHEGIAVAGTHGKSTTTAWLAYALRQAGCDPSFVVGAEVPQLGGGSGVGDGPHFVAEACEYDRSFLNLSPRMAVILNIDEDHLDCYSDLAEIEQAFAQFARRTPPEGLVLLNGDDPACRRLAGQVAARCESFALEAPADWQAVDLHLRDGRYQFTILRRGEPLGTTHLGLPGRHNVCNALAVCALASHVGVAWPLIDKALRSFRGAGRRLELRGRPETGPRDLCRASRRAGCGASSSRTSTRARVFCWKTSPAASRWPTASSCRASTSSATASASATPSAPPTWSNASARLAGRPSTSPTSPTSSRCCWPRRGRATW